MNTTRTGLAVALAAGDVAFSGFVDGILVPDAGVDHLAVLHRLDRGRHGRVAGHDDHRDIAREFEAELMEER